MYIYIYTHDMLFIVWCYLCCCFKDGFVQKRSGLLITSSSSSLMATFWASCSSCIEEWSAFVGLAWDTKNLQLGSLVVSPWTLTFKQKHMNEISDQGVCPLRRRFTNALWSTTATTSWRRKGINPQPKVIWIPGWHSRCVINETIFPVTIPKKKGAKKDSGLN